MKKLLFFALIALLLAACGTAKTAEEKRAEALHRAAQVSDSLHRQTYTVEFDHVNPIRMPSHFLTTTYSLRVAGDSVESYLPYFGVAYRADYGRSPNSPLSFNGHIRSYDVRQVKADCYHISFETRNESELLQYDLEIFTNGRASLIVHSSDREAISFTGEMHF